MHGHLAFRHDRNSAADICYCGDAIEIWPPGLSFRSINSGADDELLRIDTWLSSLTDPPLRPTPVQVVSLGCETVEAPVRESGIVVLLRVYLLPWILEL